MIALRTKQFPTEFSLSALQKVTVFLNNGKWKRHFAPIIDEWNVHYLYLYQNKESTILKQIHNIRFPSLKLLNLNSNEIESIEGLSQIYMPQLEEIYLKNNKIASIREMKKGKWAFSAISLGKNKIKEAELPSRFLQTLAMENNCFNSIKFFMKVQSKILMKINVSDMKIFPSEYSWIQRKYKFAVLN